MKKLSKKYDAYYNSETGEWLEDECPEAWGPCEFCSNRPNKYPIKKVKKNGKRVKKRNNKRS